MVVRSSQAKQSEQTTAMHPGKLSSMRIISFKMLS